MVQRSKNDLQSLFEPLYFNHVAVQQLGADSQLIQQSNYFLTHRRFEYVDR